MHRGVNHQRELMRMRQRDLRREGGPLRVPRGMLVVVVQPALPDRHHRTVADLELARQQGRHVVHALAGLVRVQPDGGPRPRDRRGPGRRPGQRHRLLGGDEPGPDAHHAA